MEHNRLILGQGLLGKELGLRTGWDHLSRKESPAFDFADINSYRNLLGRYDEIVNCVANTDTYGKDRDAHWGVNYKGVADLVDFCNDKGKKIIHVSTSYAYAFSKSNASEEDVPVHCQTWYGYTKLLADGYIELRAKDYLIVRTMFKASPFVYAGAFVDQLGNFDYVGEIVPLMAGLIEAGHAGTYNVGTSLKSMYDMALVTKKDVKPVFCPNPETPLDTSMDVSKMRNALELDTK